MLCKLLVRATAGSGVTMRSPVDACMKVAIPMCMLIWQLIAMCLKAQKECQCAIKYRSTVLPCLMLMWVRTSSFAQLQLEEVAQDTTYVS